MSALQKVKAALTARPLVRDATEFVMAAALIINVALLFLALEPR